jgi:hypothetical protein
MMDGYRITIDLTNVAIGDATTLAEQIWNENAEAFDAKLGEFKMSVLKVNDDHAFDVDWTPAE